MYCFDTRAESHCVDRLNGHAPPPKGAANEDEGVGIADTVAKCRKLILRRLQVPLSPVDLRSVGKPPLPPFSGGGVGSLQSCKIRLRNANPAYHLCIKIGASLRIRHLIFLLILLKK